MIKIGIVGHIDSMAFDGQTVKTKELYKALKEVYGEEQILYASLGESRKNPIAFFLQCLKLMKKCENIIILPAHNAVRVLVPFFSIMRKKNTCKLFYSVIGGWLPEFLEKRKYLLKALEKFNGIWVETNSMKEKLMRQGLENVEVIPNFKDLKILSEEELVYNENPPFKLCTFSRVMKEKGIEDAINVLKEINEESGEIKFTLDIYGKVDSGYVEEFEKMQQMFPEYIRYCGVVEPDKSVDVLKSYFALLFPTYYEGEGMPGTIIDAYFSGVPVIATNWRYNEEIVKHKFCGYIYDYKNKVLLCNILMEIYIEPEIFNGMKKNCIREAERYSKEKVIELLKKNMEC